MFEVLQAFIMTALNTVWSGSERMTPGNTSDTIS